MTKAPFAVALVAAPALLWVASTYGAQPEPVRAPQQAAANDISGTVSGPNGPEAGVWVIAETSDLPTKFAKIVVTDDRGRYVLPELPSPLPIVLSAAILDRYVGEYVHVAANNHPVTIRRDGDRLFIKSGSAPDAPLITRSETRFAGPFEMIFEFRLDGQGKVTGAVVEQGPNRIPLERK